MFLCPSKLRTLWVSVRINFKDITLLLPFFSSSFFFVFGFLGCCFYFYKKQQIIHKKETHKRVDQVVHKKKINTARKTKKSNTHLTLLNCHFFLFFFKCLTICNCLAWHLFHNCLSKVCFCLKFLHIVFLLTSYSALYLLIF